MRHSTWTTIETSPILQRLFRVYRVLPDNVRAPLRWLASPHWHLATRLVRSASGNRVVAGPFRSLKLQLSPLSARHLVGYILGSQELELREVTERIVATRYDKIVNVGGADGYYSVGFALRSPSTEVVSFESLRDLHPVIARTAADNGVSERVKVKGNCNIFDLEREIDPDAKRTLIFMDIEGGEITLLDPRRVEALRHADIFVETHDAFVPGCTSTLIERFTETHAIERFRARPRTIADYPSGFLPILPLLMPTLAVDLMDERRTGIQEWLYLKSRASSPAVPVSS